MTQQISQYLRLDKRFPTIWCPGCGNGIVMRAIAEAVLALNLDRDNIAMVSGIGCAGRMTGYMDFNTLHTMHGRAIPAATGIKLVRPDMNVLVVMGEGDALAIGGNHLIYAARRNLDITAIIVNNSIYGMTGGQTSPETPPGFFTTTSPYGRIEKQLDTCEILKAAGIVYFARSTVYHVHQLNNLIAEAIEVKGFSVVEVISNCPIHSGKLGKHGSAVEMMTHLKKSAATVSRTREKKPGELEGTIITGVIHRSQEREYGEIYRDKFGEIKGAV